MKKVAIIILAFMATNMNAQEKAKSQKINNPKTFKTASGLEYTITEKGSGKKPKIGDKLIVKYVGKLTNDTVFDSSAKHGNSFTFKLSGPIPANSTLIFDVELLDIVESPLPFDVKGKDTITMASGLKYIILKENKSAEKSAMGTKVTLHYSGFFKDGLPFDSSVERGQPFTVKMGTGQLIKSLEEGIALMHKGDKFKFYIPSRLGYGESGHPPVIPPNSDLIFDIEIIDVKPVIAPPLFDITGKEAKTTASGLKYYEIAKSDSTIKATAGTKVKVHYSGYLASGKMFDSSVERNEPFEFELGKGQVIAGWDEGIALMNVGDKLRLVIPYFLAYGEHGRPPMIPEKAELTFDVELIGVK